MRRAFLAAAAFALACLLVRCARVDLAGDASGNPAHDEALYASSAIHMEAAGDWLTPRQPPLLLWMSAVSVRLVGVSRVASRFPIALLCALAAGLVFWWAAEARSWQAGAAAVLLLASNRLWHELGSMCLTDGLLAAFTTAAMYCLFADPWLESRAAFWGFSGSVAAAILTESAAGALPLAMLGLYWLLAPRNYRPAFPRVCTAAAVALALAAPWFVYQLLAHHLWFWTRYASVAPPQTSQENPALYYAMRFLRIDPLLSAIALTSLPAFAAELRRRSAPAVLLASWMSVLLAAALFSQDRNAAYLLPLVPAAAILAASYGTLSEARSAKWLLALALAGLAVKAATPAMPWGISFGGRSVAIRTLRNVAKTRGLTTPSQGATTPREITPSHVAAWTEPSVPSRFRPLRGLTLVVHEKWLPIPGNRLPSISPPTSFLSPRSTPPGIRAPRSWPG